MNLVYKTCILALAAFAIMSCGDDSVSNPSGGSAEQSSSSRDGSSSSRKESSSSENVQESSSSQVELSTIISEDSTITDSRDMNTYKVMKIGDQIWMAENLKYSPEGKPCEKGKGDECLYTWAEAMDVDSVYNFHAYGTAGRGNFQGLCPAGWHVPSAEEAEKMLQTLKRSSGFIFDSDLLCSSIVAEDKLTMTFDSNRFAHDDYCDNFDEKKKNGFNMHLAEYRSGLWLVDEDPCINDSQKTIAIEFLERQIDVSAYPSTLKTFLLSLRCVKNPDYE